MSPDFPILPVSEAVPELLAALESGNSAVLAAPPGAGKTTLVPLHLLAASWCWNRGGWRPVPAPGAWRR